MNYLNKTAAADESLVTAVLSSPQCAAPQRFQKIKRKSRASSETDRKKSKSDIGKQGENPSSTEPARSGVAGGTEASERPTTRGLAGGKVIPSSRGGISYADVAKGSVHHKQPLSLTHQEQNQQQQPNDRSLSRRRSRSRLRSSRGALQRSTDASSSIEAILQTLNEKQMELMMMMMKQQQQQSQQQGQIINLLTALQARQAP